MTTPLVTIADALIEFILSLLRDPNAAAEFAAAPEETLERSGLGDICGEDVRSVVPVIVDHPDVMPRPPAPQPPVVIVNPRPPTVVEEITRVANNFHIDNRSTIVDQSVNQSIWAEGDVLQVFDQETVLAVGDASMAAGNDATVDSSHNDTTIGDVSIGNTETNVEIDESFNDESLTADVTLNQSAENSFNEAPVNVEVDTEIDDSFQNTETTVVETEITTTSVEAPEPAAMAAPEPEPMAAAVMEVQYEEQPTEDYSQSDEDDYADPDIEDGL
ncbi:MAG TPA: IniB N-terminal domain-containing protein [Arachnia sp.]|nr:IniB N-terminal domain-containing protein [Arachnia sp.]